MQRIGKDVLYFETGAQNKVTNRVKSGETFEIQTQLNAGPWIDKLPKAKQAYWHKRLYGGNPASGCVYVKGVQPGDQVAIEIGSIDLDPLGYTKFGGWNWANPGWLNTGVQQKIVKIAHGEIDWSPKLKLRAQPMLGFIGIAPKHERFHNGWAGTHAGNMDAQEMTTGTTLLLRAHHPGGLLHIGDMHAIQGDGEICGAGGIEASGRVLITARNAGKAPKSQCWPRFETETHIGAFAAERPAEDAFRHALCELIRWIEDDFGLPKGEAYMLLGQVLEARVTAFVNPTYSYVAKVNKRFLPPRKR